MNQAAEDLCDELAGLQPDWERAIVLAIAIMRAAAAEIHDPEGSEIDAGTVESVDAESERDLNVHVCKALQTAIESFDGIDAIVTSAILCVEGFDAGTTPFRGVCGSPDGGPNALLGLFGFGYETLLATTPSDPSSN